VIYGASGSGKSTLINLLAGLDDADSGVVEVGSAVVTSLDEDERAKLRLHQIGVVFQDHRLIEEFTARENVALPVMARGWSEAEAMKHALEQLRRVSLGDVADRFPDQLSGGQRQRVGIARALAGHRDVLLADEPTGSLDSKASQGVFELLSELSKQGACIVLCSHDESCRPYADSLYEMVDGKLIVR